MPVAAPVVVSPTAAPATPEPQAPPSSPEPEPTQPPVAAPPKAERPEPLTSKPVPQPGRTGNKALMAGGAAAVLVLGAFAWWLTSRSSASADDKVGLPEPSADVSAASTPDVTSPPSAPVSETPTPAVVLAASEPTPQEIIEHEPPVAPPKPSVDEAAQAEARRLKVEEEARQEQARREAQAQARQREQDKAKLNQANKTLDDLLK